MKNFLVVSALFSMLMVIPACDPQSEIAKKSVEKYADTPTPTPSPTPTEEPIDPADVVEVDTSVQGPNLSSNTEQESRLVCDKYNRVMLNGSGRRLTIKGVCSQLMINGNSNEVTLEATAEIVLNGRYNIVRYSRIANGKRPAISGRREGSTIEKIAGPPRK